MSTGTSSAGRNERRRQEARAWFIERRSRSEWPTHVARRWRKWSADVDNMLEYHRYGRVDLLLREIPPGPLPSSAQLRAAVAAEPQEASWALPVCDGEGPLAGALHAFSGARQALIALGCVVLLTLAIWVAPRVPHLIDMISSRTDTYHTGRGERAVVSLEDHSVITLGAKTELTIRFTPHRRHVVLRGSGEALFAVAHDSRRPFEVEAGAARIMNVGTTFNVRSYQDKQVVVAVSEGAVAVTPLTRSSAASVVVKKGEEVSSDANGVIGAASPTDLKAVASWLFGSRIYREKPLGQVLEDVQRYTSRRIFYDGGVRPLLFNGMIDQNKVEQWIHHLPTTFPVTIDETDPRQLFIHCKLPDCRRP